MSAAKSGSDFTTTPEFLTALGQDVQITVRPTRKAKGEMAVVAR